MAVKPAAVVVAKNPTDEFLANVLASPRMWSQRWMAVVGLAIAIGLQIGPDKLFAFVNSLPFPPAVLGLLVWFLGFLFRVWPQFNLFAKLLTPRQQEVVEAAKPMPMAGAVPTLTEEVPPKVVERMLEADEDPEDEAQRELLHVLVPTLSEAGAKKIVAAQSLLRRKSAYS